MAAIPKLLSQFNFDFDKVDVIELNESFAALVIPVIEHLGFDINRVNPNGGVIVLGHPLGATGGILMYKVLSG